MMNRTLTGWIHLFMAIIATTGFVLTSSAQTQADILIEAEDYAATSGAPVDEGIEGGIRTGGDGLGEARWIGGRGHRRGIGRRPSGPQLALDGVEAGGGVLTGPVAFLAADGSTFGDGATEVTSYGLGLRYRIARLLGLDVGVDYAFGPDQDVVYIQFGHAWESEMD